MLLLLLLLALVLVVLVLVVWIEMQTSWLMARPMALLLVTRLGSPKTWPC